MSGVAVLTAWLIALPVGLVLGHVGRGGFVALNVANVGRAVPSFAVLVLAAELHSASASSPRTSPSSPLAMPPMVTNAYIGVRDVDADIARGGPGHGHDAAPAAGRVELPLAVPLVMAGVRTAAVQVVATATLAALVAGGGLGRFIVDGLAQRTPRQLLAGAFLVAGALRGHRGGAGTGPASAGRPVGYGRRRSSRGGTRVMRSCRRTVPRRSHGGGRRYWRCRPAGATSDDSDDDAPGSKGSSSSRAATSPSRTSWPTSTPPPSGEGLRRRPSSRISASARCVAPARERRGRPRSRVCRPATSSTCSRVRPRATRRPSIVKLRDAPPAQGADRPRSRRRP